MKAKIFTYDDTIISDAWKALWKRNLAERKAGRDYDGRTYFLTATDIERKVRDFMIDDREGKKRGTSDFGGYCDGLRVSTGRRGGLKRFVRDWLRGEVLRGALSEHNFDRGHISGARYRPRGEPLSPAETKTFEEKAKPRAAKPVHFTDSKSSWGGRALCVLDRWAKSESVWHGVKRSTARVTKVASEVTCPRCLKLLAARKSARKAA